MDDTANTRFANRSILHHTLQFPIIDTGDVIEVKETCRQRSVNVSALIGL